MNKRPDKFYVFLICLLLGAVTFIVYYQALNCQFLNFDDGIYVTENEPVKAGLTGESIGWAFKSPQKGFWHPLTWLSHMLDCEMFGLNPKWHHLVNLLFHIANTLLLFCVLANMTAAVWQSAFVAAAFALHPLHIESVAWVAERKDVLSSMFWLLTMAAYLRYARLRSVTWYMVMLLLFTSGLLAKPMLVTLPFVLLLLDYWPLNRLNRQAIFEKLPFLVLSFFFSIIAYFAQQKMEALPSVLSFDTRSANALVSYLGYIEKTFWPAGLAAFYPHPCDRLPVWRIATAAAALLVISALAARSAKNHKYLLVGWLWYLGTLVPVIGLVQVGSFAMADRYTYIPLIGLFIIIAWGLPELLSGRRYKKITIAVLAAAAITAMSVCTYLQLRFWRNSDALFEHAIAVTENNNIAHYNLATSLQSHGRADEAIYHYRQAIKAKPDYMEAYNNLGAVLESQNKFDEAIYTYQQILKFNPDNADIWYNIGNAYQNQGKYAEAAKNYQQALQLKPGYAEAHNNLGRSLQSLGRVDEAINQYRLALRAGPKHLPAYINLGRTLQSQGKYNEAIDNFRRALQIEPNDADTHEEIGILLGMQGKFDEAGSHLRRALLIKPDSANNYNSMGILLGMQSKFDQAADYFRQALKLQPKNIDALYNLGRVLQSQGKSAEAADYYRKVLEINPNHIKARQGLGLLPGNAK